MIAPRRSLTPTRPRPLGLRVVDRVLRPLHRREHRRVSSCTRIGLLGIACFVATTSDGRASEPVGPVGAASLAPVPVPAVGAVPAVFDPRRDALVDLQSALSLATAGRKRVLVDIGGDWCAACLAVDRFFDQHVDLRTRRDEAFVYLRVNVSDANANAPLIKRLPWFFGYPHWFVLDADGRVLESRFATFDVKSFEAFVTQWPRPADDARPAARRND